MQHARMHGFWTPRPPVRAIDPDVWTASGAARAGCCASHVRATTYVRPGLSSLVALASWSAEPCACALEVLWGELGLAAGRTRARTPTMPPPLEQSAGEVGRDAGGRPLVELEANGGALLLIERK